MPAKHCVRGKPPCRPGLKAYRSRKTRRVTCRRPAKATRPLKRIGSCGYSKEQLLTLARRWNRTHADMKIKNYSTKLKSQLAASLRRRGVIPRATLRRRRRRTTRK